MSFGKMNCVVDIVRTVKTQDKEGFVTSHSEIIATVRMYREGRHGSVRWANLAAFSGATDLFRFRCIPGLTILTSDILACGSDRFRIISVEDVKGRGMYHEVLAERLVATNGEC